MDGGLPGVRRFLSPEGRTANLTILLVSVVVPVLLFRELFGPVAWRIQLLLVVLIAVSFGVARRFGAGFMRSLLLSSLAVGLLALVALGREEIRRAFLEEARAQATQLAHRLAVEALPSPRAPETPTSARGAVADLDEAARAPAPDDPAQVAAAALVTDLRAILAGDDRKSLLSDLRARAAALPAGDLATKAQAAVETTAAFVVSPPAPHPSPEEAKRATVELCQGARGELPAAMLPYECKEDTQSDSRPRLAAVRREAAEAELELARYRLAIATTDAARKELAGEVDKRKLAYEESARGLVTGGESVGIGSALERGATAVLPLPQLREGRGVRLAVGALGWILAGVIAVVLYRSLERRAAKGALGPVAVDGPKDAKDAKDPGVESFRAYLLRNIPEPGAYPGAAALQTVSDLLSATQLPGGTYLSKLVTQIVTALSQPRGYTVTYVKIAQSSPAGSNQTSAGTPASDPTTPAAATASSRGAAAGGDTKPRVVVRVNDARTGRLIHHEIVEDDTGDNALRHAAYWAAAVVMSESDRVPRWDQWSPATSRSLAAFYASHDRSPSGLEPLEEAVRGAPTSGALALQLSHAYALIDKHLLSFELALRAAMINKQYLAGRYRAAVTASLVASDLKVNWFGTPRVHRDRVSGALQRYDQTGTQELRELLDTSIDPQDRDAVDRVKAALCNFALDELTACAHSLSMKNVLRNALRRSERSYWVAFLRFERHRTRRDFFLDAIESARPAIMARGGTPPDAAERRKHAQRAESPNGYWMVAYNLACLYGVLHESRQRARNEGAVLPPGTADSAARALYYLELARERPGSHQMKGEWLGKDPDLKSLRVLDRFVELQKQLEESKGNDADQT